MLVFYVMVGLISYDHNNWNIIANNVQFHSLLFISPLTPTSKPTSLVNRLHIKSALPSYCWLVLLPVCRQPISQHHAMSSRLVYRSKLVRVRPAIPDCAMLQQPSGSRKGSKPSSRAVLLGLFVRLPSLDSPWLLMKFCKSGFRCLEHTAILLPHRVRLNLVLD